MTTQAAALQNATIAYEKAKAQYDINVAGPTDSVGHEQREAGDHHARRQASRALVHLDASFARGR